MTHALNYPDKPDGLNLGELQRSLGIVVTAASDTAATLPIGAVYYLCKTPSVYAKLKDEIRKSFASEEEISLSTVSDKPSLLAVLREALRIHPPIAGNYVPPDTPVSFPHFAGYHSERNWNRPGIYL